uniref:Calx-beta domain-containing protein n=1 Tax=Haptolina brevifila TaxID=156173 RepID=A0A7S2B921_9EUKA|mmetsp:Transcript_10730/g.21760  ORF Transcript_10730/g.21760 Transcript_10730/m.21760 type:complete len:741 (+) Transcript_10730:35-2257(+)|eukprot:CAMPEP_0174754526 /NCGR_PEP_ID=MMETSP1094-20130205/105781_1 /TAXON_ID=156173 /ORGANISM="Chrysochromulina brevifilum, Strain UTEX LB 985" /LENGTH=740 /DNA_ID=CAMNT_0015960397 /DNA_START=34 /DNA_END=2256 /DNA_ORIENTATION=-
MGQAPSISIIEGSECNDLMVRDINTGWTHPNISSGDKNCCPIPGIVLSTWVEFPNYGIMIAELLFLCYVFLGVALGADVFMTSIEVITSKEKTRTIINPTSGQPKIMHFRVWNPTIANLTLMALGSSAPEILLSVIEVLLEGMATGALGPSTIVGSAAFNLMVITAVCIVSLEDGDVRTLKQLGVFLTTAVFSLFAYIWLFIMVISWTPEVVTVEEGCLTIFWMVLLIILAYAADKYWDKMFHGYSKGGKSKDVAAAIKSAGLNKDATPDEIARALQDQIAPPRSRAYYRHKAMEDKLATTTVVKRKVHPAEMNGVDMNNKLDEMVKDAGFKTRAVGTPAPKPIDPNSAGVIRWEHEIYKVPESCGKCMIKVVRVEGLKGEVTVEYATKDQQAKAGKDYDAISGELTFKDGEEGPKELEINIHDDDEFEKDEHFTVVLSEPKGGVKFDSNTDGGTETEVCTVVILNDDVKAQKVKSAIQLLRLDSDAMDLAATDWKEQIMDVFTLPDGNKAKCMHIVTFPWKVLFNILVAPPGLCGGWPCFFMALGGIGFQVLLIADFATQMGCLMGLPDTITAITFVALGTSLPDTFASMQAARGDKYADNSIGNVTGSNSVNVFFGLGLPWLIGSAYWAINGIDAGWHDKFGPNGLNWKYYELYKTNGHRGFRVSSDGLGVSVIVFTVCAILTLATILLRRFILKAELGGNKRTAKLHAAFLVGLWVVYILFSILLEPSTGPVLNWKI